MNFDLLIKLAKLANNNPNEHEANAAARKVCSIIEENNYKFDGVEQPKPKNPEPDRTWNDVKRSGEPFWKSWEDEFWKRYEKQRGNPFDRDDRFYSGVDWSREPPKEPSYVNWEFSGGKRGSKRVYHQKHRTCTICNTNRLTAIDDEPYVCGACKWKKYQEAKGETNV